MADENESKIISTLRNPAWIILVVALLGLASISGFIGSAWYAGGAWTQAATFLVAFTCAVAAARLMRFLVILVPGYLVGSIADEPVANAIVVGSIYVCVGLLSLAAFG